MKIGRLGATPRRTIQKRAVRGTGTRDHGAPPPHRQHPHPLRRDLSTGGVRALLLLGGEIAMLEDSLQCALGDDTGTPRRVAAVVARPYVRHVLTDHVERIVMNRQSCCAPWTGKPRAIMMLHDAAHAMVISRR